MLAGTFLCLWCIDICLCSHLKEEAFSVIYDLKGCDDIYFVLFGNMICIGQVIFIRHSFYDMQQELDSHCRQLQRMS